MIQRLAKTNDLTIQLQIDYDSLHSLSIEYFTDDNYVYTITKTDVKNLDEKYYIFIPSSELLKMNDGQLMSKISYSITNSNYSDGTYDNTTLQYLPVWLYSKM